MTAQTDKQKAKFYPPSYELKRKAGHGGISNRALQRAQEKIETPDIDYSRYGTRYIREFGRAIRMASQSHFALESQRYALLNPVMMLKASGAMFGYTRVSEIAEGAMFFIETLDHINDDALQVLRAYHDALKIMIDRVIAGSGGQNGQALVDELERALQRYYNKHPFNKDQEQDK